MGGGGTLGGGRPHKNGMGRRKSLPHCQKLEKMFKGRFLGPKKVVTGTKQKMASREIVKKRKDLKTACDGPRGV